MRIINTHVHLIEKDRLLKEKDKYLALLQNIPAFKDIEQAMNALDVETVLTQMKEAGISRCVLFACQAPVIYASNEFVSRVCAEYPEQFTGFASVDPKHTDAAEKLEQAIRHLGLKGLKLHPPLQDFFPNDPRVWPVYQKASDLGIPVVFHVGSTPFGGLCKLAQANPILIDEVAVAFAGMKIILTHLGTLWQNETFMVAEKNPNVYIDTSAYPYEISELLTEKLIRRVGENKFVFGTDFPMPYEGRTHRMRDFVECINNLRLPGQIKERIFHGNFEEIINQPAR